jgi:hypothetical protein
MHLDRKSHVSSIPVPPWKVSCDDAAHALHSIDGKFAVVAARGSRFDLVNSELFEFVVNVVDIDLIVGFIKVLRASGGIGASSSFGRRRGGIVAWRC